MRPWVPWALLFVGAVVGACAAPVVVRDGRPVPVAVVVDEDLARVRADLDAGRLEEARIRLERLVEEVPRGPRVDEALFLLGEVYARQGNQEQAIITYRRVIDRAPRGLWAPLAHLRLAELYRASGRPELARHMLAELALEGGHDAEALRWLAYQRRDLVEEEEIARLESTVDELLSEERLSDVELRRLDHQVPPGPVHDLLVLELARRSVDAGDPPSAEMWLERLPARLRPAEEAKRSALLERLGRDAVGPGAPLGIALPLTGPYGRYGWSTLQGIVLGLGIYGDAPNGFQVHVRDTRGEPELAARAVQELRREGAVAVLGPLRSAETEAAAPEAQAGGIPLLAFAQREDLPMLGGWVFRLGVTRSDQVRVLVRYAIERKGLRRFAVLYPKDGYGTVYKNLFWDEVERMGGEVVGIEGYPPDAVDVQLPIRRLVGLEYLTDKEQGLIRERDRLRRRPAENAEQLASPEFADLPPYVDFDALFIPEAAQRVGLILPQLRFYDILDVLLMGPSGWNDRSLVEIAGRDAEGVVFSDVFFPDSDFPFVQEFVSAYYAAYGEEPDALAAEGYDAASLLRDVLTGDVASSRARARTALLGVRNFPGVSGVTSFDETGGTRKNLYILTIRRGEIAQLDDTH
jgi:ABC-type branched-subunit amino acid transport system substrate-binding protein